MEPKRIHEVVHTLRQKPQHVRENIALGVSGGVTLLVALGWLAATVSGGVLAPSSGTLADNHADVKQALSDGQNNFSTLLGAAGAAMGASSSPATITIVDTEVHSTLDQPSVPADATVIHF
ncbi:MAG: hypothetical protein ACM3TU_03795 [Bacillota bacterium]